MEAKRILYNELFECYKDLLTEKEKENFSLYYAEDLSIGEIADVKNVSRTAVHKQIKTVLEKLEYYETTLRLYEYKQLLLNISEEVFEEKIKNKINNFLNKE